MTISAKLSDVGGLEFIVSDPTDTDDVGGFSDPISTGAKSAKFSGGADMQANSGLRIGTSQIKVVAGGAFNPAISLGTAGSDWSDGAKIVDGLFSTSSGSLGSILPTVMEVVVDFGTIASRPIGAKFSITQPGNLATNLFTRMTSRIFVSDTETFGAELGNQVNTVGGTNTGPQTGTFTHDESAVSFRFAKFTMEQEATNVPTGQRPGTCNVFSVNLPLDASSPATVNIRSSATKDTADGTIIKSGIVILADQTITLTTELLLVASSQFLTLDYITQAVNMFNINFSDITSVKEV